MRATIICPTHNHGHLIHAALRSALRQTHQDFELFVIGDGVTAETREAVLESMQWDPRFHFVEREKSSRHGETYRHEVLQLQATGEFVCYLSDDDLWLPHHLGSMCDALRRFDVAHSRTLWIPVEGMIGSSLVNWSAASWREWTLNPPRKNGVGLSQCGHRMDFYRTLPHGWRTTPPDAWSDHYMWQQILRQPGRGATGTGDPSTIQFPSPIRGGMTLAERYEEMCGWEKKMVSDPDALSEELRGYATDWEAASYLSMENELRYMKETTVVDLRLQLQQLQQVQCEWTQSMELQRLEINKLRQRESAMREKLIKAKSDRERWKNRYEGLPRWLRSVGRRLSGGGRKGS
ncbi:glycosyltransferase family 2 protein [Phragmitibacter flavus]|uniref:Glycosyltransferase family 2 protein n=1 Tax=Phragmitibacter flavus TaxID=2576071 RepID=A0A5R8KEH9_9BACT|nr:glycosyltransferase family A protein [Phragmitibacter flavus]TLD70671.1 glycosyltransferase family 2 protein [Phragmitibacter flavus]